jgi:ABC-type transport system involved in multi-copper enzyme maturation permease subunit
MMFAFLLPYSTYRGGEGVAGNLAPLLPENLIPAVIGGFPVFGGVIALMLGVLVIGSDYGWETLKTVMSQRPGRVELLISKLAATFLFLILFVLAIFSAGAIASYIIANLEGVTVTWPSALGLVEALAAGWFLLAIWASIGVALAVLSRGTALAIGLGVLYALFIESLLSALAGQISWLASAAEYSIRANAYSIVTGIGVPPESFADNGPGGFFGPYVGLGQAILVLGAYAGVFLAISAATFVRRDVV